MAQFDSVEHGYVLSINRYKKVVPKEFAQLLTQAILDALERIEKEITWGNESVKLNACGLVKTKWIGILVTVIGTDRH